MQVLPLFVLAREDPFASLVTDLQCQRRNSKIMGFFSPSKELFKVPI